MHVVRGPRLKRLFGVVSLGMTAGSLLLLLPFTIAGPRLLSVLFGPEFARSSTVLVVLGTGAVMNAVFGANAAALNMTGHQSRVMRASVLAVLVLVAAAPPLILAFGILGAATASVVSLTFWNVLMWRDSISLLSYDTSPLALLRLQVRRT